MERNDDKYYITLTLGGNKTAFARLVDKYKNYGMTLANSILKDKMRAEEVLQDSFLSAFRKLGEFDLNTKFHVWIYRIIYNKSIDYLRKRNKELKYLTDWPAYEDFDFPDILENDDISDMGLAARAAINKLDERSSAIITMYYYDEMSVKEIAEVMSLSESSVKVTLHRSRIKLKEIISRIMNKEKTIQ